MAFRVSGWLGDEKRAERLVGELIFLTSLGASRLSQSQDRERPPGGPTKSYFASLTLRISVGISSADSLLGKKLSIHTSNGKVMINDATVVQTDVAASNGVIHVIDKVILPN
ncbi:MAG: fasciclin domain-containing protein [Myxococcales bacterium]|nr:fasciclin domain-containing protein [Myxococcales bacterium]